MSQDPLSAAIQMGIVESELSDDVLDDETPVIIDPSVVDAPSDIYDEDLTDDDTN